MPRIVETLTTPQTARARMRAGSGFEAEAVVTVSPVGLLAIGGMVAAILVSTATIVRAARRRVVRPEAPVQPALTRDGGIGVPLLPSPNGEA